MHAQIHAMEFTGTTAALHLIDRLLHGYGKDERITKALDTRTFYVVPRVNPDGADAGLADGRFRRSSVRPYPREEPQDGLHRDDVDGDGRVLMMRLPDPNGAWKPHPDEPRLLVARRPDDVEGDFYRVFPEGTIQNWDGVTVKIAPRLRRARPQPQLAGRLGAGGRPARRRPVSRPPSPRCARSWRRSSPARTSRATSGTTRSAACTCARTRAAPDDDFPTFDLRAFQIMGEEATRLTGYPTISIFHDFKYDPKLVIRGGDVDWIYDFLGRVRIGDRVLEPAARSRARGLPLHRVDPRPPARGRPRAACSSPTSSARATSTGTRSSIPSSARWSSAAGTSSASGSTRPSRGSRTRSSRTPTSRSSSRSSPRGSRFARSRPSRSGAAHTSCGSCRELRLASDQRHAEGARAEGRAAGRGRARAAGRRSRRRPESSARRSASSRAGSSTARSGGGTSDHSTSDRAKVEWVVEAAAGARVGVVARHDRAGTARAELVL